MTASRARLRLLVIQMPGRGRPPVRRSLERLVRRGAHLDVQTAGNMARVLARIPGYDALLVDTHTEVAPALELLRQLNRAGCCTPCLLVVTSGDQEHLSVALAAGAVDCVNRADLTLPLLERCLRYATERVPLPAERLLRPEADRPYLAAILAQLPSGVAVLDLGGSVMLVNAAAKRMLGRNVPHSIPPDRDTGIPLRDPATYRVLAYEETPAARALQGIATHNVDYLYQPPGAPDAITLTVSAVPLRDAAGAIQGAVVVSTDVTGERALHQELARNEATARLLFTASPQPMWVQERGTFRFLAVNDAALARYGYTRDEFLRLTSVDIRPAEDVARYLEYVAQLPPGLSHVEEWRHRCKDGRIIDVEITTHAITYAERPAVLVLAVDITQRKLTEQALRASEDRYRAVSELTSDFAFALLVDAAGQFSLDWMTQAYTTITGYGVPERGTRFEWPNLIHPADQALFGPQPARLLAGEEITSELRIVTARDQVRWIHLIARPVWSSDHTRVTGAVCAVRDITEQRLAAEARNSFVASVSHELRTPLTAILGYAELLEARWDLLPDTRRHELIKRVAAAARRQLRLVEDLLLVSRLDANALTIQCGPTALAAAIAQAVEEVRMKFEGQQIILGGSPCVLVDADGERLVQILVNLIDNAAKYSPETQPVEVDWQIVEETVFLRVRDHGPGVPSQGRELLFTRFGRLDGSRSRAGHVGTGLGLYLSRQFARAMGGDLLLETTGPLGSVFLLHLPLAGKPRGAGKSKSGYAN